MKRHLLLAIVVLFSTLSCNSATQNEGGEQQAAVAQQDGAQVVERVDNQRFNELLSTTENAQLIDVRTPEEYGQGHIGEAQNINFFDKDFKDQIAKLNKEEPVMLYCRSGGRSGKALVILKDMGFKTVYELRTGYMNWKK